MKNHKNITHQLPADKVAAQVEKNCAEHEKFRVSRKAYATDALQRYEKTPHLFGKKPEIDYIDPMCDGWIEKERTYYAKVRVVHVEEGFILVYGDEDDATVTSGTGPFKTLKEASSWFLNGGR
jgi:hypothetical protein